MQLMTLKNIDEFTGFVIDFQKIRDHRMWLLKDEDYAASTKEAIKITQYQFSVLGVLLVTCKVWHIGPVLPNIAEIDSALYATGLDLLYGYADIS